jgi:N-acetylmuramoyl-L-alanine amidase
MERRNAVLNDVVINLLFAPSEWKGNAVMSLHDFKLVLEPVLRRKALPRDEIRRIVIDAGHGGKDPGAQGSRHDEKDITLAVALRLGRLLKARGFQVLMTRVADDTRSLSHRTTFAARCQADLFISLHINAAGNARVTGIETFILTPENSPSTYGTSRRKSSSVGNAFDAENMLLAYEIQKRLRSLTGADDRGVKHANFKVLREAPCASALVELGFISNKSEEARMANPRYQHKLASGIALGVMEFAAALKK